MTCDVRKLWSSAKSISCDNKKIGFTRTSFMRRKKAAQKNERFTLFVLALVPLRSRPEQSFSEERERRKKKTKCDCSMARHAKHFHFSLPFLLFLSLWLGLVHVLVQHHYSICLFACSVHAVPTYCRSAIAPPYVSTRSRCRPMNNERRKRIFIFLFAGIERECSTVICPKLKIILFLWFGSEFRKVKTFDVRSWRVEKKHRFAADDSEGSI